MATILTYDVVRGNRWLSQIFVLIREDFDWTGTVPTCHIRQFPTGPLLAAATVDYTLTAEQSIKLQVRLEGSTTFQFPLGMLWGDVKLYRPSPLFGPYTPFQFILNIIPQITL